MLIAGRYEVLRTLGEGASGVVYLAREVAEGRGRPVALKVLKVRAAQGPATGGSSDSPATGGSSDSPATEAFRAEFSILAALASPHVVSVHDFGSTGDPPTFWFASEYVEGCDLAAYAARGASVEDLVAAATGVLHGLAHVHARGLVHLDVKPANVRVTEDLDPQAPGRVRPRAILVDFGLARGQGEPVSGGSLPYVAPEVLRGDAADRRADLYSLGATLYHALAGEPPFVSVQGGFAPPLPFAQQEGPAARQSPAASSLGAQSLASRAQRADDAERGSDPPLCAAKGPLPALVRRVPHPGGPERLPPFVSCATGPGAPAPTRFEMLRLILEGRPAPLRARRPELSLDLEAAILKLLRPEPADRFGSAEEAAAALALAARLESHGPGSPAGLEPVAVLRGRFVGRDNEWRRLREAFERAMGDGAAAPRGEEGRRDGRRLGDERRAGLPLPPPGSADRRGGAERRTGAERRRMEAAGKPAPRIALLGGPAGGGKSRLLRELVLHAKLSGALVAHAAAASPDRARPFGAALALLESLRPDLEGAPLALDLARALARPAVDGAVDLVLEVARRRPLLVALDELESASEETVELLRELERGATAVQLGTGDGSGERGAPRIFLAVASRPAGEGALRELARGAGGGRRAVQLDLGPLGPDDVSELVRSMLGVTAFPRPIAEAIWRETQGLPGAVEAHLRALVQEGRLVRRAGRIELQASGSRLQAPGGSGSAGPQSGARSPKPVLSEVEGPEARGPKPEEASVASLLERGEEAREAGAAGRARRFFRLAVDRAERGLREAPRGGGARRELAAGRVRALEALAEECLREATRLGEPERERRAALLADAAQACARLAHAAERRGDRAAEARALERQGSAEAAGGRAAEARALLERSAGAARAARAPLLEAAARRGLGDLALREGRFDEALRDLEAARELAEQGEGDAEGRSRESVEAARYLRAIGRALFAKGAYAEARAYAERALGIEERAGERASLPETLELVSDAAFFLGDHSGAIEARDRAIALARERGDRPGVASGLYGLALVHDGRGDLAGAREHYRAALALWRRLGDRRGLTRALAGLGEVALLAGDLEEAEAALNEAATIENEIGGPAAAGYARALARLGLCHLGLGEPERAAACYGQAARAARRAGAGPVEAEALRGEAEALAAQGDLLRAIDMFGRLRTRPEVEADPEVLALALIGEARALLRRGEAGEARARAIAAEAAIAGLASDLGPRASGFGPRASGFGLEEGEPPEAWSLKPEAWTRRAARPRLLPGALEALVALARALVEASSGDVGAARRILGAPPGGARGEAAQQALAVPVIPGGAGALRAEALLAAGDPEAALEAARAARRPWREALEGAALLEIARLSGFRLQASGFGGEGGAAEPPEARSPKPEAWMVRPAEALAEARAKLAQAHVRARDAGLKPLARQAALLLAEAALLAGEDAEAGRWLDLASPQEPGTDGAAAGAVSVQGGFAPPSEARQSPASSSLGAQSLASRAQRADDAERGFAPLPALVRRVPHPGGPERLPGAIFDGPGEERVLGARAALRRLELLLRSGAPPAGPGARDPAAAIEAAVLEAAPRLGMPALECEAWLDAARARRLRADRAAARDATSRAAALLLELEERAGPEPRPAQVDLLRVKLRSEESALSGLQASGGAWSASGADSAAIDVSQDDEGLMQAVAGDAPPAPPAPAREPEARSLKPEARSLLALGRFARAQGLAERLHLVAEAVRETAAVERVAILAFEGGRTRVLAHAGPAGGDDAAGSTDLLTAAVVAAAAGTRAPAGTLVVPFGARPGPIGAIAGAGPVAEGRPWRPEAERLAAFADLAALAVEIARIEDRERRAREDAERAGRTQRDLEERLDRAEREREQGLEAAKVFERSRRELESKYNYANIVGRSDAMRSLFLILDKITDTDVPVLVQGESGTGKELVAKAIHVNGPRLKAPFLSINCAAFPETLLEAELFGHVRGAFTGADRDKTGLFEAAHRGTLFLDEVGEMSPGMQAKLLRVLQEGEVRPVGAKQNRRVDVRILSASNQDLRKLVEQGRFRMDLFYRLNVINVTLPPLRERKEDIPLLVEHFLRREAAPGTAPKEVGQGVLEALVSYQWPGNVRELENEVRRAFALSGAQILPHDLSPHIKRPNVERYDIGHPEGLSLKARIEILERRIVKDTLQRLDGNKTRAAQELGLSRFGFLKKLDKYGLR